MALLKYFILSLTVVFALFSCKDKTPELPMKKQKLVDIMTDIYIAESMASHADLSIRDSVHAVYLKQVSERHNMSIDEISNMMKKLAGMPDSLYLIQGIVIDSLSAKQRRVQEK